MLRNLAAPLLTSVIAIVMGSGGTLVLSTTISFTAGQYGSEEEARAMLQRAVAAVKENKDEALAKFNKGEGGFKDRDLYVFCANASDGVLTAHPYLKGENLKEIVGKKGFPLGQEIMQKATEGQIKEVSYWWPRPGSDVPLEKHTFLHQGGRSELWSRLLQAVTDLTQVTRRTPRPDNSRANALPVPPRRSPDGRWRGRAWSHACSASCRSRACCRTLDTCADEPTGRRS